MGRRYGKSEALRLKLLEEAETKRLSGFDCINYYSADHHYSMKKELDVESYPTCEHMMLRA